MIQTLWRGALLACALVLAGVARAEQPTVKDLAYGDGALQKLDIYRPAQTSTATPFVLFIHGGGWFNGDKAYMPTRDVDYFTSRGIAVIPINYRNIAAAQADGLFPPLLGPLQDAQRALQFLRYHAKPLGLDPKRVVLFGESAGAFDALWLGLAPDRARPDDPDRIAQQSTRVAAIATVGAQTSIDPAQMRSWVGPNLRYGGQAFGLPEKDFEAFLDRRWEFARYFPILSPAAILNPKSPPLFLLYTAKVDDESKDPMDFVHSPRFGQHLAMLAGTLGVPVTLRAGASDKDHADMLRFLAQALDR